MCNRQTVLVSGTDGYQIQIGFDLLDTLGTECTKLKLGRRAVIITDANVAPLYAEHVCGILLHAGIDPTVLTIPAGEQSKSLSVVETCLEQMASKQHDRNSFVIALGGGVVGDLAGTVASLYMRGLPLVQVPTTLLAQIDSSIGGKVGVNLNAGKNLAGSFYPPKLVLSDLATLKTLPKCQMCNGMAEAIKYGAIDDAELFTWIEKNLKSIQALDPESLTRLITRCSEIKVKLVTQDPHDKGIRASLNFGHTIGHAIENVAGYGTYSHGEAISIGMVAAAHLSMKHTGLSPHDTASLVNLLNQTGLPVELNNSTITEQALMRAMRTDKKNSEGHINFVLLTRIGAITPPQAIPEPDIKHVLQQITHLT